MIKTRSITEQGYMRTPMIRFYTTQWSPNGTSELIITDDMNQIISVIPEALFNAPQSHNRIGETFGGVHLCPYDDSVMFYQNSDEFEEHEQEAIVYPLSLDDVLESLAQSPVKSRFTALRELISTIKAAVVSI